MKSIFFSPLSFDLGSGMGKNQIRNTGLDDNESFCGGQVPAESGAGAAGR
jgi:hypothetical protein